MLKKSLLSLAIAASLGLAGCSGTDSTGDTGPNGSNPNQNGQDQANNLPTNAERNVHPIFYLQDVQKEDVSETGFPVPADFMYANTLDGTFNTSAESSLTADGYNPVTHSLDDMTGASTTAAFDIEFSGDIDSVTYGSNVFLVKLNTGDIDPVLGLSTGDLVDFSDPFGTIGLGVTNPVVTNVTAELIQSVDAGGVANPGLQPASDSFRSDRSRIRLTPTEPLDPKSRYLVILTRGITAGGEPIDSSNEYDALSAGTDVVGPLTGAQSLVLGAEGLAYALQYGTSYTLAEVQYDAANPNHHAYTTPADPSDPCATDSVTYIDLTGATVVTTHPAPGLTNLAAGVLNIDVSQYDLTTTAGKDALYEAVVTAGKANYALTYTFTTEGTKEVLTAMASPLLLQSTIQDAIISGAVSAAQEEKDAATPDGQCSDLTDAEKTAVISSVTAGAATASTAVVTDQFSREAPAARSVSIPKMVPGAALAGAGLPANINLHVGTIELPYYLTKPDFRLDDDASKGVTDYIAAADDSTIAATAINVISSKWEADDRFGTEGAAYDALSTDAERELAQAVAARSTLVTRLAPFAKRTGIIKAPLVVVEPTDVGCPASLPVVVYQHGITTNRALSLPMAAALSQPAAGCNVVVAIDFPLHGQEPDDLFDSVDRELISNFAITLPAILSPLDSTDVQNQAYALVAAGSGGALDVATVMATVSAIEASGTPTTHPLYDDVYKNYIDAVVAQYMMVENHFNLTNNGSNQPRAIDYELDVQVDRNADGDADDPADAGNSLATEDDGRESGSLFINLLSQQTTRDNLRQAVVNLLNVNASIDNIAAGVGFTRDVSKTQFIGHSLGAIVGASAAAVNNEVAGLSAALSAPTTLSSYNNVVLGNGGTSLPKLIENSPAFSTAILGGLGSLNIFQGNYSFETMLSVFQGALQSVDPVSWASEYSSSETLPTGSGNYGFLFKDTDVLMHKVVGVYSTFEGNTIYGDMAVPNNARAASEALTTTDTVYMNSTDANDMHNPPLYPTLYPALPLFGTDAGNIANAPITVSPLVGTDPLIELASGQDNGEVVSTYGGCTTPFTLLASGTSAQTPDNGVVPGTNAAEVSVIETCGTHGTFSGLEEAGGSTIFSGELIPAIITEFNN